VRAILEGIAIGQGLLRWAAAISEATSTVEKAHTP
jgi:hypothetical protein